MCVSTLRMSESVAQMGAVVVLIKLVAELIQT